MTKFEKSCGAVIFKTENDQIFYLTVEYKKEKGYWGLVKGHVETGETEHETARREIYEEVGLSNLRFSDDFRAEVTYSPKPGVEKLVVFFLAQTFTDQITFLWDEQVDHAWLSYNEIIAKLTYPADRSVIERAHTFLAGSDLISP